MMSNIITFLHIKDNMNSWKGVYLNGNKIADGYFNLDDIKKAEDALKVWGGLLGFTIKHLEKEQSWFTDLGGVLPEKISFHIGEVISEPNCNRDENWVNYYYG